LVAKDVVVVFHDDELCSRRRIAPEVAVERRVTPETPAGVGIGW